MTDGLQDLLDRMREHPSFPELLRAVDAPEPKRFYPSQSEHVDAQSAIWIYRSGCQAQNQRWLDLLTDKEKP